MISLKVRTMIVAPKDHVLLSCDLSQAESWVVAYLAGDDNMKEALKAGILHETTAWGMLNLPPGTKLTSEQRYAGKQTNHGTAYRMGVDKYVETYNKNLPIPISIKQGKINQDKWHSLYPRVKGSWWPALEREAKENGNTLTTPYGRKRTFYGAWDNSLLNELTAYKPQSTVADHFNGFTQSFNPVAGGLITFRRRLPTICRLINQSHDSFLAEVPTNTWKEIYDMAKDCFYRPVIINGEECWIPVDGEVGERWGELEKIK